MNNDKHPQSAQNTGSSQEHVLGSTQQLNAMPGGADCPDCAGTGFQPDRPALPLYFCKTCQGTGLADPTAAPVFVNKQGIVAAEDAPLEEPRPQSPLPLVRTTHPYADMCALLRILRYTATELQAGLIDDEETQSHQDHLIRQVSDIALDLRATLGRSQITIDGMKRAQRHLQAIENAHWILDNLQGEEDYEARECALYALSEAHDSLTVIAGEV